MQPIHAYPNTIEVWSKAVWEKRLDLALPWGWLPHQRVTLTEALRNYAQAGAYASFEEKDKGRLAPGMLANIVILNKDPFVVPTQELHQIEVDSTIFDGRVIYKKN